jgi:hypothetical protein
VNGYFAKLNEKPWPFLKLTAPSLAAKLFDTLPPEEMRISDAEFDRGEAELYSG